MNYFGKKTNSRLSDSRSQPVSSDTKHNGDNDSNSILKSSVCFDVFGHCGREDGSTSIVIKNRSFAAETVGNIPMHREVEQSTQMQSEAESKYIDLTSREVVVGIGMDKGTVMGIIIDGTKQSGAANSAMSTTKLSYPMLIPIMFSEEKQGDLPDGVGGEGLKEEMCRAADMGNASQLFNAQKEKMIHFNPCTSSSSTSSNNSNKNNGAPMNSKFFKQKTEAAFTSRSVLPVGSAGRVSGEMEEDEEEEGRRFERCSKSNSISIMECDYGRKEKNSGRTVADSTYDRYTYKENNHLNRDSHSSDGRINKSTKESSDKSTIGGKRDITQIRKPLVSNKMATFLR